MHNIGLKIYLDSEESKIIEVVNKCKKDNLSLEVAFFDYKDTPMNLLQNKIDFIQSLNIQEIQNKNIHFNYNKTIGYQIDSPQTKENFIREIKNAKKFGINEGILHYHHTSLPDEEFNENVILKKLITLNNLCISNKFFIYIENTAFENKPANSDFYHKIFNIVITLNLTNIGFCFDFGHGKFFSTDNLGAWYILLGKLASNNVPLHFHLHNNDNLGDKHFSFLEAEKLGLNIGNEYTAHTPYLNQIKYICENFNGKKILENKANIAVENYDWLTKQFEIILSQKNYY